jgi:hypothetical protein
MGHEVYVSFSCGEAAPPRALSTSLSRYGRQGGRARCFFQMKAGSQSQPCPSCPCSDPAWSQSIVHSGESVSGGIEVVSAFVGLEEVADIADGLRQIVDGSCGAGAQMRLEL